MTTRDGQYYREAESFYLPLLATYTRLFFASKAPFHIRWSGLNGLVLKPLELAENKLSLFLERFPEYRKTLGLAVAHEEAVTSYLNYQGWQWSDVETHPTKLIRLVTEGISRINLKTRQATHYVLRDRDSVKRVLGNLRY